MGVRRIIAYAAGSDVGASQDFYVNVLGMTVAMVDPVVAVHPAAGAQGEVIIGAREMQDPGPDIGVDLGNPAAVEAAYAEVTRRGLHVAYPLTDEIWGVRRFFVEDPSGTVVNVLAHVA